MKGMLLRWGAAALGFISISLASPPAYSGVIYFGGAPNQEVTSAQYPPYAVLMSFTLRPGTNVVTGAEWYGSCGSTACGPSPKFTIAIYADDDGLPGAFLFARNVGSADQTAIGNDEYAYSVTFPSKTLTPGTSYLFGVYVTAASEPTWGIEQTSNAPPGSTAARFDTVWSLIPENLAFNLTGPGSIPEPSTWAMMILGFGGLGFLGHRRTAKVRVAPRSAN
jgi:PEP-CTERM motif